MVAEAFSSDRMSPLTVASLNEDVMTMGQLEGESKHTKKSVPALVSPPASPTTTKVQVQPVRKKRAYRKSKPSTNTAKRQLPADFQPSSYSVICGRGKECFDSCGNKRFRQIINKFLDEYADAPGKSEKSAIVSKAMNIIREASPEGAFVKCENGVWFEVSSRYAREKVGAWFRDCLSSKYKSSSKAKHARKMAKRVSLNALDPEELMNFPLEVEFDLPELDREFYDEYDRRHNSHSADNSNNGDTVESSEGTAVTESTDDSARAKPIDPPTQNEEPIDNDAPISIDPPGDFAEALNAANPSFYDVDDISLTSIPFDAVDVEEI